MWFMSHILPGFVDPDSSSTKVYKDGQALYGLHQALELDFQMSSMGELTFFLGLQVKQNKGGIFISQDKYVAEILKKFDLVNVKAAITPMETKLPLTKDEEAFMFGLFPLSVLQRLLISMLYCQEHSIDSDYGGSNLDRKSTTGGCQFLGQRLISWQCKKQTIVATSTTEAEYVAAANCCGQVLHSMDVQMKGAGVIKSGGVIGNTGRLLLMLVAGKFDISSVLSLYALTTNPTIYDSLVKQFWQTATANTNADGTLEIKATLDTIRYTISEASIRDSLQLEDATGITMLHMMYFLWEWAIGYPIDGNLYFLESLFTPQWRYLVHIFYNCISLKSGGIRDQIR
ncbi:copia protein [Tanacetum coccineum]